MGSDLNGNCFIFNTIESIIHLPIDNLRTYINTYINTYIFYLPKFKRYTSGNDSSLKL